MGSSESMSLDRAARAVCASSALDTKVRSRVHVVLCRHARARGNRDEMTRSTPQVFTAREDAVDRHGGGGAFGELRAVEVYTAEHIVRRTQNETSMRSSESKNGKYSPMPSCCPVSTEMKADLTMLIVLWKF